MVKKRLCVPATSVPSERVFSKAGLVLNNKRTRLTTEKVGKKMYTIQRVNNYIINNIGK